MTAPRRWVEDPDEATDEERAILRLGLEIGPPAEAEERTWRALLASLGPPPVAGGEAPPGASPAPGSGPSSPPPALPPPLAGGAATKATGLALALKSTAVVLGLSAALAVGYRAVGPSSPAGSTPAHVASTAQPTAPAGSPLPGRDPLSPAPTPPSLRLDDPAAVAPVASTAPATTELAPRPLAPALATHPAAPVPPTPLAGPATGAPTVASAVAAPVAPALAASAAIDPAPSASAPALASAGPLPSPQTERATRLQEESALVGQANAALQSGNPTEALRLLAVADARFPGGVLGQERELLTIEALGRSGQRAAASQRAAAFVQAHPRSPHMARLRPYLP